MKTRTIFISALLVVSLGWMIPTAADGATYYVAKNGSNDRSCTQAQSAKSPKLTIGSGLACTKGGDTLIISPGTYAEGINNTIPSGINTSNRTRIKGLNGARWILRPSSISQCFKNTAALRLDSKKFVEIAGLVLDGTICTGPNALVIYSGTSSDNVLRDSEIKNARNGSGISFQGGTTSRITLSNVSSHNHGNDRWDHCFYPSGADHVLENLTGYNCYGHGLHLYHGVADKNNRNIIKSSSFHNNGSWGIGIYRGSNNQVFANSVASNGKTISYTGGIRLSADTTNLQNNTIANHGQGGYCIRVESSASGSIIQNNLCLNNSNNTVSNAGANTTLVVGGTPKGPVNLEVTP